MLELNVTGMTCGHCVRAVTHAIRAVDPEADVQVDLAAKRVRVEGGSSAGELIRVLDGAGYPAVAAADPSHTSTARKGSCGCE